MTEQKFKLLSNTIEKSFFNEFKKDLKEIFDIDFNISTINKYDNFMTTVNACNEFKTICFKITPMPTNCGALIACGIYCDISLLSKHDENYSGDKFKSTISAINKCITRCMEYLSRRAVYYTASETQTPLRRALVECGYEEIGDRWENWNSDNEIITLIRVRD